MFDIKAGDTSPALLYSLVPVTTSLLGASVEFRMRRAGGPTVVQAPAVIVSTSPPVVRYDWQPGDTAAAGLCQAEFVVTYADGSVGTFPNLEFIPVSVNDSVRPLP